jgi:tRNA G10  N-methylase Trm11
MKTLAILGRELLLCQAELEAVYDNTTLLRPSGMLIEATERPEIERLGGSIKLAQVLSELEQTSDQSRLANALAEIILTTPQAESGSKISFALSGYGKGFLGPRDLRMVGVQVKKLLTSQGRSARYIQPKSGSALTAAQLKYNQLTTKGLEIIIYLSGGRLYIAQTYAYQDIDSYSKRDWDRPVRDSKVGMLPPKLAQIMINLARSEQNQTVYDPFCGNGVILQEALLSGHNVVGSDLSEAMVSASQQNLTWLQDNYKFKGSHKVWQADATTIKDLPSNSAIVTEGFLGTPIHGSLRSNQVDTIVAPTNKLYLDYLSNLRKLLQPGERIVLSFPTWQTERGLFHLPVIDQIDQLGYTFEQCSGHDTLVYRRENQFVGREIAVLIAK